MSEANPTRTVAVIGGGVAGLAVTFELMERAQAGTDLELMCLEASDRPGGNIRTTHHQGFTMEWGPNGFLDNSPPTLTLAARLGLQGRVVRAEKAAAKRFIFRAGKLRRVPESPGSLFSSGILPFTGALRLLREPFVPARPSQEQEEAVFDFAARRIGRRAAEVMVDAMVSGVYAGDSHRLSLEATFPVMREMESQHGSLFRAMLARRKKAKEAGRKMGGPGGPAGRLTSFRGGLQELTDALAQMLEDRLHLSTAVEAISDLGDRGFRVHPAEGAPFEVDAVVLACPSTRAATIVGAMDPEMSSAMRQIPSASLAVVHFGYPATAFGSRADGFGYLVPRGQGPRILGTLWSSQIFRGRAPKGRMLMTSMIGGAHDPDAVRMNADALVRIVRADLLKTMGTEIAPSPVQIFRHNQGIPQYTLGHMKRLATIEQRLDEHPGLWVSGNSYRGISVNACIEEASRVADAVFEHVTRRRPSDADVRI